MVSEIFPVVASEKVITQHIASRSMINKRQLPVSSTIVRYTHCTIRRFTQRHKK